MLDISLQEDLLLVRSRIPTSVAGKRSNRIVIVVSPLGEVIGKLNAWRVRAGIFEINDDKLLVLVGRLQQRRLLVVWGNSKNVSILRL